MINSTLLPWSVERVGSKSISDMVQFSEGGIADMWGNQSDPQIKALSYALTNAVALLKEKADVTKCYSDIDSLPENVLDYFAVEMRAMYYSQDFPIEKKREIIKDCLIWYTKAGTPSAVEEMITAIFGECYVEEWFDFSEDDGEAVPYTFDIISEVALMDPDELLKMIAKVKNVRSHLRRVRYLRTGTVKTYVAIQPACYSVVTIGNMVDTEHYPYAGIYTGTRPDSYAAVTIGNMVSVNSSQKAIVRGRAAAQTYTAVNIS